jgi:hypothetical protein
MDYPISANIAKRKKLKGKRGIKTVNYWIFTAKTSKKATES